MRKVGWLQNTVGPMERHRFAKMHKSFTIQAYDLIMIRIQKTAIQTTTFIMIRMICIKFKIFTIQHIDFDFQGIRSALQRTRLHGNGGHF